jgi:hypothetical protein
MDSGIFWRLVLVAVAAFFAIKVILWAIATLTAVLKIGITIAIVFGIVWLLMQIFGRKKAYL